MNRNFTFHKDDPGLGGLDFPLTASHLGDTGQARSTDSTAGRPLDASSCVLWSYQTPTVAKQLLITLYDRLVSLNSLLHE